MTVRIGVDTGGTFTDVCLFDESTGRVTVVKVSSTPADPGVAVLQGVRSVLQAWSGDEDLTAISYLAHGTTVATNALLQHRGATLGLITTAGLRDLLELGRQRRPRLYDLAARKPSDLVPRELRLEVQERLDHTGAVRIPLDEADIRSQVQHLKDAGVGAVAICLLYSYLDPAHEQAIAGVVREMLPDAFLSVSHEVLPEFREFERLSTTAVNAFVGPVMHGYLSRLRTGLAAAGLRVGPKVTQSNGGVISFEQAAELPVRTVLSGPSTGVVGAAHLSSVSGHDDIITFDMGGTSTDIALVRDARPVVSAGTTIEDRPIRTPMLDISTVGAGGGSIAWIDDAGHLKVGPQSAGADPGPACYALGSGEATVTDANVVLGVLHQRALLGGRMSIDPELSVKAVARLADRLGLGVEQTAQGIISVVTANMARAIRRISVQRGYNPADYTLVAFGGAGPLHAARLAAELGMSQILLPPTPGAMSAMGMLMTDVRCDFTRTRRLVLDAAAVPVAAALGRELTGQAHAWFDREGVHDDQRSTELAVDVRYLGQNYEIRVPVADVDDDEAGWLWSTTTAFEAAHQRRYGYVNAGAPIELVTFRVAAAQAVPRVEPARVEVTGGDPSAAVIGMREVHFPEAGGRVPTAVYDRAALRAGDVVIGPAVIEQYDATTVLLPGQEAEVDAHLAIICRPASAGTVPDRSIESAAVLTGVQS
ncbi:hydantoinase/oxoprolinase family protein [Nakamurella sp. YIM 132087]|uniref:Hydantoinase/oxoprolinase family protein n=1 Tax=Nakamurella alba TaxID=2665158 RepID=A0A7K1FSW7_9ACTN|nr:hydantoinase/oxoprolinase family protein [Nakamurella alba]MTD16273.1 hydantoinase/oxoprolinase family protein [Nakamurella alba]